MNEEWKPIPGYEGLYEASSFGRIRSAEGKTTSNARYKKRVWKSRILKPKCPISAKRHDKRVTLWKDGKHSDYLVARLVCSAWNGSPNDEMTVNHINGNYLDNRPENLEWLTIAENIKHGFRTGLFSSIQVAVSLVSETGEAITFPSMSKASVFLGHTPQYLSLRIARGFETARSVHGEKYRIEVM